MMPFTVLLFCFCLASAVDQLLQPSEKVNFNAQQTSSQMENIFPITSLKPNGDQMLNIRFDPPHLDFGVISVGTAQSHTITVINQHNRSVYLGSVSGQISSFYSSFFETKIIPPQGNTTFNVVFLPRESGTLQSVLHVHSSFGLANFSVRGVGTECPYKLQPIVGVKAPLNATLTPEIHMFNPHKHTMQIIEVYSSGGQFQLELPSGGQEGPQALWEIPPYSTKPVIRIRFHGKNAGNHTAYIRIKVLEQPNDSVAPVENVFVIPVEFEIQQENGLYAENPLIDFGRIVTQDTTPTTVKLNLRNSDENSPYELVYHDLHNISGLSFNINDTSITLDPMLLDKSFNFKLALLRSALKRNVSHIQEFSVLIRADVFKGTLSFNRNTTIFITGDKDIYKERKLIVRNDFKTPLLVLKSSVDSNITKILNINQSHSKYDVVLKPGESLELMQLRTKNISSNFRSMLNIYTNVTRFGVPLLICTGQLHVHTQISGRFMLKPDYNTDLNLGLVPLAEMSQPGYIVLQNKNPIPIKVTNWDFQTKRGIYFHTTFMGCAKITSLTNEQNIENVKYYFCSQLNENEVAVFELAIQSYITENKSLDATLQIWTPYENITATVRFKTMIGELEVDQETVYFKNCFPGMLCSSDISIRSTFQYPIHITSVNFTDPSMHFEDFNPKVAVIDPGVSTKVGRLYFSPAEICKHMCYIPQDERTNSLDFLSTQPLTRELNNNPYFDEGELRRRTELYRQFKAILQSISFRVSTQEKRQFVLQLMIDIVWPKLVSGPQTLPSVEINKSRKTAIVINNPANKPILVDFFLSNPKFAKLTRSSLPLEVVVLPKNCHMTDQSVFSLSELSTKQPVLIPAYENITVTITFTATQTDLFCTLLHIRNNLTLYEGVWISAKGVQSQFRFGNRKPGSITPLLFEVNEKHLSSCYQQMQPTTTITDVSFPVNIKRTFTARNTGEIPIFVETFFVEGQQCIGYGFKIVDCTSFELAPNASKKIEILFSPDFTIPRIAKLLVIKTNLSYSVNYTLLAQLPTDSLELCGKLVARPEWETKVWYAALIVIFSSLAMVFFAVHLDLYKIFKIQDAVTKSRDKGPVHPTFNLRNIGIKSLTSPDDSSLVVVTKVLSTNKKQKLNQTNGSSNSIKKKFIENSQNSASKNLYYQYLEWPGDCTLDCSCEQYCIEFSDEFEFLDDDKLTGNCSFPYCTAVESSKCLSPVTQTEHKEKNRVSPNERNSNNFGRKQTQQQRSNKKSKNNTPSPTAPVEENTNTHKAKINCTEKSFANSINANKKINKTPEMKSNTDNTFDTEQKNTTVSTKDTSRRYGKTPGRERKRELQKREPNCHSNSSSATSSNSNFKLADRKKKVKVVNSLNFDLPTPPEISKNDTELNCITSPWETSNQVSFGDVLQKHNYPQQNLATSTSTDGAFNLNQMKMGSQNSLFSSVDLKTSELSNICTPQNITVPTEKEISISDERPSSTELGPIGTRKSPSLTPVWESVTAAPMTATSTQLLKPQICSNSSFFSSMLPTTYEQNNIAPLIDASTAQLLELQKAQAELQRQWQTNEYLFNLRQRQIEKQQQQQLRLQAQQQLLQGVDVSNSWALNSHTWSPLVYGQSLPNDIVNSTGINSAGLWQNAGLVRPPPGLLPSLQSLHQTQQQQQQPQQQSQQQESTSNDDMQTFDPFSSLSSIWCDNWIQNNNNQKSNNDK